MPIRYWLDKSRMTWLLKYCLAYEENYHVVVKSPIDENSSFIDSRLSIFIERGLFVETLDR